MMVENDTFVPALRFHFLTSAYDAVVRLSTRERRFKTALIEQADILPSQSVLDLACGTGTLSIWVKQRFPDVEVFAIDGDPAILARAAHKARSAHVDIAFEQGLSHALPYPDDHFDRVLSSLFFHHLSWEGKQRTAQELLRVLKPGGELHVADWGQPANPLMRLLFRPIQWLDGMANTQDNASGKLIPMFEANGFANLYERRHFNTAFGTLRLFSATKPLILRSREEIS